ncbi:TetR/AcrR family transcriptional regulator [Autumnicola musiva]|uniref:TetR/AcrR family transcriptional regulator n=1 Tax=Autumnicola musiva TaxID=3075589 RepID=A0ABU3DAZ2_9FLAO|nr:TetR/AcrR family transcriptional regulator [Zunongwangia sp. F117]MDT0678704.1 TetR/AcrR family transcriptional regulator [Zunongwangia sp. F117]
MKYLAMDDLLKNLQISVSSNLYLKDPESSELGRKIIGMGIILIDKVGFEKFTFKKLGEKIQSNESSVYRYFENKHSFLVYITNWFWGWKGYQLALSTYGIDNVEKKLLKAVEVIAHPVEEDMRFKHINEVALNNIIINESSKSYLTKKVDEENEHGHFILYKNLVNRISKMISEVDPDYQYPFSLATTIIDGSLHQHFLSKHFSSISDCTHEITPSIYFKNMVSSLLNTKNGK